MKHLGQRLVEGLTTEISESLSLGFVLSFNLYLLYTVSLTDTPIKIKNKEFEMIRVFDIS